MNNMCLNKGFVYHRAWFRWVSLDDTLNMTGAQKIGTQNPVVCHSCSRPCRVSGGRFPISKLSYACS